MNINRTAITGVLLAATLALTGCSLSTSPTADEPLNIPSPTVALYESNLIRIGLPASTQVPLAIPGPRKARRDG